ncbi:MAG: hypothetical protein Q9227_001857 [Pyrenula ochraceoflavens]
MLYFIGLGLADELDITVKGLEIIRQAKRVYLEAYTSILLVDKSRLELFYGRDVTLADREMVESASDEILQDADKVDVAFLVVGDPFGATTHADLSLRARQLSIPTKSIPNASIMNAIGACGLSLYNYGQTVSMVFFTDTWRPASFYDRIYENAYLGLHTLVLLDIKVKEPNLEAMAQGKKVWEPPRYMSVAQCAQQMIEVEEESKKGCCAGERLAIGAARVGSESQIFVSGTLQELSEADLGDPLHCLILVGKRCHEMEAELMKGYAVNKKNFDEAWNLGGYGVT